MITEIVTFRLPEGWSRKELLEKYHATAATWSQNPDLVRKYYFWDQSQNLGGGVYIWKSLEAAQHWHGEEYKKQIKEIYGAPPTIQLFEALIEVDNAAGSISNL